MVFRTLARRLVPAFLALALLAPQAEGQALELSLLVDISGSVDDDEFALQIDGYVAAFQSAAIQNAIAASSGGIAVNMVFWSGVFGNASATSAYEAVAWTLLTTGAEANAFAAAIAAAVKTNAVIGFQTHIGNAINFGVASIQNNGFSGDRQVIDISGDGTNNGGLSLADARQGAIDAGITINGVAITTDVASLLAYYQANVITPNGFALEATDFTTFAAAMETKLEAEIIGTDPTDPTVIPEPATMVLLATGLIGMGAVQWRRRRKA